MRRVTLVLGSLLLAAAGAGAGHAQDGDRRQVVCLPEAPPFAATPDNQLKGEALSALFGKTLVVTRKQSGPVARNARFRYEFRSDGSVSIRCEVQPGGGGAWRPCPRYNPDSQVAPDRDLGTWRIEADAFVFQRVRYSAEGRGEGRFTFHRAGGVFAIRHVAGTHFCLPGPVQFQ